MRDEYQLYLVTLGSVGEDGDVDRVVAEEYRVWNDGSALPAGVVRRYPYALRPCPAGDTAST